MKFNLLNKTGEEKKTHFCSTFHFSLFLFTANCTRETLDKSGYYCNKGLVQLLVFDAKVTNASYGTWEFESRRAEHLINMYNATLRFVATMSGLTRWQFIFGETEVEGDKYESFFL